MDDNQSDRNEEARRMPASEVLKRFEAIRLGGALEHLRLFQNTEVGRQIERLAEIGKSIPRFDHHFAFNVPTFPKVVSDDLFKSLGEFQQLTAPIARMFETLDLNFPARAFEFSPALEEIRSSPLFEYLRTLPGDSLPRIVELEGAATIRLRATGEAEVRPHKPELEQEIVSFLQKGNSPDALTEPQRKYLVQYLLYVWKFLQELTVLFALVQMVEWVEQKVNKADSAAEVRRIIKDELSADQRELLSDYRVVLIDGLKLRGDADKNSTAVGSLRIGTMLEVIQIQGGWAFVSADDQEETRYGWVYISHTAPFKRRSSAAEEISDPD